MLASPGLMQGSSTLTQRPLSRGSDVVIAQPCQAYTECAIEQIVSSCVWDFSIFLFCFDPIYRIALMYTQ